MKRMMPGGQRVRRRSSGFSLLEVLIATAVLAFGILGMAQLFLMSIQYNRRAAQNAQSSNLLSHRLEQVKEMDYCWLKAQNNINWLADTMSFNGENMGQNPADPKVFAGREKKNVGGLAPDTDWVIERRIIAAAQIDKQQTGEPCNPVLLVELRGYRRGVRSEKSPARPKWIYMSAYRSPRMNLSQNECPPCL